MALAGGALVELSAHADAARAPAASGRAAPPRSRDVAPHGRLGRQIERSGDVRAVHGGRRRTSASARSSSTPSAATGAGAWRVSQRFDEPDGSTSEIVTNGDVVWGGHGHDHWHVHLGASYWLTRPGSSAVLRSYDKVGFCFFDQRPPRDAAVDRSEAPAVPEERLQRPRHPRVHDGPLAGLGRPVPLDAARPAAPADGPRATASTASGRRPTPVAGSARPTRRTTPRGSISALQLRTTPPRVEVVRRGPAGAPMWRAR